LFLGWGWVGGVVCVVWVIVVLEGGGVGLVRVSFHRESNRAPPCTDIRGSVLPLERHYILSRLKRPWAFRGLSTGRRTGSGTLEKSKENPPSTLMGTLPLHDLKEKEGPDAGPSHQVTDKPSAPFWHKDRTGRNRNRL